ncbi:ABC transporter substrate-binding protein [Pusillimonas sp.]|uniref:ABC transporter substrate-binding protein n=1 Tax=Pusillimonas sp. TaxID=3040095 RepID=UPI0029A728D7|nr:ABC transporter substrate-binding protein [Pusillimonas sp.]MDX3895576.1 ABC transporter substrate-binding protein [Pusillimonas sp.]
MKAKILGGVLALACTAASAAGADAQLRVGFMGPMTGPLGITGQELRRGFDLALEHLGGRIGGLDTEVAYANDQANPGTAAAEFTRLVEREKVSVVIGIAASNVAMALVEPAAKAGVTVLLAHAGPNELAGKGCAEHMFSIGHQNEQFGAAMGRYIKDAGLQKIYGMSLDYQGGHEMIDAAEYGLGQKLVAKVFTPLSQVDFAPELSRVRASKPDGLFVFYPGSAAVSFVRQYAGTGLKQQVPLYTVGAVTDSMVIKAQGDAALGVISANTWNSSVHNPQNDRFTADFKAKNDGREPTTFSAQAYDTVMYLDAALRQIDGNTDTKALRAALRDNKEFKSIRGPFKLNTNQFPIQNMVIQQVEKSEAGGYEQKLLTVVESVGDSFAQECPLTR